MEYNKDESRYSKPEKRKLYQREYKRKYMKEYRKKKPEIVKDDSKHRKLRRIERKKMAIEMKGGKCCRCGYNRNMAALDFHHKNGKDIHWTSERNFLNWGKDKFLEELKKVELVCSNCHQEIHHPEYSML